jgi:hypothetical protein
MEPVAIDWTTAEVEPSGGNFILTVKFSKPASPKWWQSFGQAIEILSKEITGAQWEVIRQLGTQPEGIEVSGVHEGSEDALRRFLDSAVRKGNEQAEHAAVELERQLKAREAHKAAGKETAEQLKEAFRAGASVG